MIIHFHGDLATLLPRRFQGQARIEAPLGRRTSVKDLVEAYDVPHTEVGRLTAAGREVPFAHIVDEEETIEVYPPTPPVDVLRASLLRPQPLPRIAFAVDANVGKLSTLLRMTGFDTLYYNRISDARLAALTAASRRILLTKDKDLLKRKEIEHGRLIRAVMPEEQLLEVLDLYGLRGELRPFSRCLRCNEGILEPVAKASIIERLEPLTIKYYESFRQCSRCARIFWAGSHKERMEGLLGRLGLAS